MCGDLLVSIRWGVLAGLGMTKSLNEMKWTGREIFMPTAINFKRTKFACYASYFTMSAVVCVPPLLFVTLRQMYGISYTLLGTLDLINICTQLGIDLIFTMFSIYKHSAE